MKLAKQNVKKLGFLPKGTYDAQIIAVEEYFDYYEEELYWLFRFKIIQKDDFIYYDYCLKYSERLNTEFSSVLMYLRYLQGKRPGDLVDLKELPNTFVTLEIGYDIEIVRTMPKKAIFRNYIERIDRPKNIKGWLSAYDNEYARNNV